MEWCAEPHVMQEDTFSSFAEGGRKADEEHITPNGCLVISGTWAPLGVRIAGTAHPPWAGLSNVGI